MDWIQFGILLTTIIGVYFAMAGRIDGKKKEVEEHAGRHTKVETEIKELKTAVPRLEKLIDDKFNELKEELRDLRNYIR